jgi:hypothetical protein
MTSMRAHSGQTYNLLRYLLIVLGCIFIIQHAYVSGRAGLGVKETDSFSESQAVSDARNIFAGKHRFGIVEYCHFPNGPVYMLLVPLALGFDSVDSFRLVPLGFSAACIGVLFLGLALYASSIIMLLFALMGVVYLLRQPGVLYWMGGMHEQSYALSICFAAMGLSLMPIGLRYSFMAAGFIAGWIGYDMLPAFVFSVFTCRMLLHSRSSMSVIQALRSSLFDTVLASFGALLAIGTHLVQNAFFWGSIKAAFNDLVGSAAARAGVESAATMNQGYWDGLKSHLQDPSVWRLTRFDLVLAHARHFLSSEWTDLSGVSVCFSLMGAVVMVCFLVAAILGRLSTKGSCRATYVGALSMLGAILAGVTWIILMPHHARFHFHFLPRHFFVPGVLMWIILYAALEVVLARVFSKHTTL